MDEFEGLSHTKWECKYHVMFIPKCRRKTLYGELRKHLGEVFWARGFLVSTVGREESVVREYIRTQEEEDKRLDQLEMWK